jgi:transketolase
MSGEKPQRIVFGEELVKLGSVDQRIVVLDADVSSSTQTRLFAEAFPQRFFNFGIAEANMVSAAAGLATVGFVPVVSSFALFLSLRAGEQVRAQIAGPELNVKLIGGYAGLSDYADGASHQSVEDLAVMRALPNMTVIAPSDAVQTRRALRAAIEHRGPVFLRISREAVAECHGPASDQFRIGRGIRLREGDAVALIATGTMVGPALEASRHLESDGVSAAVVELPTLKPLDEELILATARATGAIVTIEEHSVIGGLGSAVCETVCRLHPVPVIRCGIPDRLGESGAYAEILARAGLDVESIRRAAGRALELKERSDVGRDDLHRQRSRRL